jgi:hypothetical protein
LIGRQDKGVEGSAGGFQPNALVSEGMGEGTGILRDRDGACIAAAAILGPLLVHRTDVGAQVLQSGMTHPRRKAIQIDGLLIQLIETGHRG